MSQKIKTLRLTHGYWDESIRDLNERNKMENRTFKVEQVTDTVEFYPGQTLTKKEVDVLCASAQWKVTVVSR